MFSPRKVFSFLSSSRKSTANQNNSRSGPSSGHASNAGDSSDDDESFAVDEEAKEGSSGTIVFKDVFCVKTDKRKTFHFHPYSGNIYQHAGGKKRKKIRCPDVQRIFRHATNKSQMVVDLKRSSDMSVKQKKFIFASDEAGEQFKTCVEFWNAKGALIRDFFDHIDQSKRKSITRAELKKAAVSLEVEVTDEELLQM